MNNKLTTLLLSVLLALQVFVVYRVLSTPQVGPRGPQGPIGATADNTTNWTAGSFSSDLDVGGYLTVVGTSTFSGEVSGVAKSLATTMSSSATTTACAPLNNSAVTRTVLAASVVDRGTAASTGAVTWQAGTSTGPGVAATTKIVNTVLTRAASTDIITTTSTILGTSGAYSMWRPGEYFVFISGTTTNAGTCRVLYY